MKNWNDRSVITKNLLNPAFCSEVIRKTIKAYNINENGNGFPYSLLFLILPIVLHKRTRQKMPRSYKTYFHSWVDENESLFIDFANRVKQLSPFTKEAIMFLLMYDCAKINDFGCIEIFQYQNKTPQGNNTDEITEIYKKAELLGKWFCETGNEQTIYMFLKIRP